MAWPSLPFKRKPKVTATPAGPTRSLVTPEGLDLRLQVADASERAAAFLIDMGMMVVALILLTIVAISFFAAKATDIGAMLWLVGFFVLRNFYFMLFELGPRAATPGKRMLGLRVAARDGSALTADAVFARNAMRELEVYLPMIFLLTAAAGVDAWLRLLEVIWCGVFVLLPLFNRDRLRAGDLVAGTWVVKAPRRKLPPDLADTARAATYARFDFTLAQLDAYGVKELHVLETVLRRYDVSTVTAVAARIRAKIGWMRGEHEGDGDFLDAYYRALRGRLEQRLLFGRRRKDKFDRD